jgi:large subunit ribosomal protein L18
MKDRRRLARERRQQRVRKNVRGDDQRPRLSVYRSERHIYGQVISDAAGRTLVAASTLSRELRDTLRRTTDREAAKQVGLLIAKRCQERGISKVVFDRNGFVYHGRVKAVADGAREGGLEL